MHRLHSLAVLAVVAGCAHSSGSATGADASSADVSDSGPPDGQAACAATEICDGVVDDNCNGVVDEGCGRCPLLSVACASGCCSVDRWEVSSKAASATSLDVDDAGDIYFAYSVPGSNGWTTELAVYDAQPGTWRTKALGVGTYRARVKLDSQGRVHVVYGANGGALYYGRSDDHGATFSSTQIGVLSTGGLFDLALDSTGAPHVAYAGDQEYTSFSDLRYAHIGASGWTSEVVDADSHSSDYPDIEIGFADRPHIVYDAYDPPGVTATTKRYAYNNGNRWVFENLDTQSVGHTFSGDQYFSSHVLRIAPDDARELLYTRHDGSSETLVLAKRGPLDADTWQQTTITGASDFATPVMFVDEAGMHGALSDGLRIHREAAGAVWTSAALGMAGTHVATARRGRYLYVGFVAETGHPTLTVLDLKMTP